MGDQQVSLSQVEALGRMPWNEVAALLDGATCVWQDLRGLHRDHAPDEPPLSTHLWAWRDGQAWRFRLDGDSCVGAELTFDGTGDGGIRPRPSPDPGLSALLGELGDEVRIVVAGDQSQAVFLVGSE